MKEIIASIICEEGVNTLKDVWKSKSLTFIKDNLLNHATPSINYSSSLQL